MMIKLTEISLDYYAEDQGYEKPIYVNKYQIKYFSVFEWKNHKGDIKTYTDIQLGDRVNLLVKETPKTILAFINMKQET